MSFLKILIAFGLLSCGHEPNNSLHTSCKVQYDTLLQRDVYIGVDSVPVPKGGAKILYRKVMGQMHYPKSNKPRVESRIMIAFVVNVDGSIEGERVLRTISGTDLAQQFLDIVHTVEWKPGYCNGKPVSVLHAIPLNIHFR